MYCTPKGLRFCWLFLFLKNKMLMIMALVCCEGFPYLGTWAKRLFPRMFAYTVDPLFYFLSPALELVQTDFFPGVFVRLWRNFQFKYCLYFFPSPIPPPAVFF